MRLKLWDRVRFSAITAGTVLFGEMANQVDKGGFVAREFKWGDHVRTFYLVRGVERVPGTMEPRQ